MRVSPEADSVAEGCVAIAIFSIDGGSVTQQVLHHIQVALAGGDVQGCPAIVILHRQVRAL